MKSREKRITSGNYLEIEHFPVTEHGHRHDRKKRLSRKEQQNLNEKNAIKKQNIPVDFIVKRHIIYLDPGTKGFRRGF